MITKLFYLLALTLVITSCQFTEELILNEDGSGRIAVAVDLKEMLQIASLGDSVMTATDTIINMKDYLEAQKDSIAKLPANEQAKLKKLENYVMHLKMDPETNVWDIETYLDFKNIEESNNLMNAFEVAPTVLPSVNNSGKINPGNKADDNNVIGTNYSFKNGIFKRDSYIKDKEAHKKQVDSLKSAEMMMGSVTYKLKYTFPKRIKKSSLTDATYSLDGKTLTVEKGFLEYIKNPDVLDIEVELEK